MARSGVLTVTAPRMPLPEVGDLGENRIEIGAAIVFDQAPRFLRVLGVAEQEGDFHALAGRQHEAGAQRRAGIEARAEVFRQGRAAGQRRRRAERPVAADEFTAVAGPVGLASAEIGEGDARAKTRAPAISGEDRARPGIERRRDEIETGRARRAERPFDIGGDAEMAGAFRQIAQFQPRDLDRAVARHELQQVRFNAVAGMLEAAVAATEAGDIGRPLDADGRRGRAPEGAGIVVTQVESLAGAVGDGVVRPGRELVLAAVDRPGVAAAFGRRLEAKTLVGDDIDPGAGVACPGPRIVTYSWPSLAKPPRPLKNSSFSGAAATARSDATCLAAGSPTV